MKKLPQNIDFSLVLGSSIHDMKDALGLMLNTFEEVQEQCEQKHSAHCRYVHKLAYDTERVNFTVKILVI